MGQQYLNIHVLIFDSVWLLPRSCGSTGVNAFQFNMLASGLEIHSHVLYQTISCHDSRMLKLGNIGTKNIQGIWILDDV